jgi:hypothetical protein
VKKILALLTLALVFIPATASAHHRQYGDLSFDLSGSCPEYSEAEVGVRGYAVVAGERVERAEVVWRLYEAATGEGVPFDGYWLRMVAREFEDDSGVSSSFSSSPRPAESVRLLLTATARWHTIDGEVVRHTRRVAEWIPWRGDEPIWRCRHA